MSFNGGQKNLYLQEVVVFGWRQKRRAGEVIKPGGICLRAGRRLRVTEEVSLSLRHPFQSYGGGFAVT